MVANTTVRPNLDDHEPPIVTFVDSEPSMDGYTEEEATYFEASAGVYVRRWRTNVEPWSQWELFVNITGETLTAEEALVFAAAVRRAALRTRQLNEANS